MSSAGQLTNLSAKSQEQLGLTPGTQFYSPFPFGGINTNASRIAIDDTEFSWMENFVRLGDGKLRTLWDIGKAIYAAPFPRTIVSFAFYNIGTTQYVIAFLDNGTAYQTNLSNGVIVQLPTLAHTFYLSGGSLPATTQWGTLYLAISNRNTVNDYWLWDGALLYTAGTLAPQGVDILSTGSNYSSVPGITTFGGKGSGATYSAQINAGGVVEITITNPGSGYEVGDIVQLAFSGGGSDNSAILQAALAAGSVVAVNITAPGSGYSAATVSFSGGGGTGAAGTVIIGTGVDNLQVTDPGSNYTTANVFFSGGGGSGAAATATIVGGQIVGFNLFASGSGYTSAPTVTIVGDGSGAAATAGIQNGIVTGIEMTDGGTDYTSAPTVTITGTGTGALGQAIVSSSGISTINVINPGSGFVYPPLLKIEGGGGSGAQALANLTPTSIAHINVIQGGSNWGEPPIVKVEGGLQSGGVAATARAVVENGSVVQVVVTSGGHGYIGFPYIRFVRADGSTDLTTSAQAVFSPTSIASVTITDYGLGYTDAPAVLVQPGANNAAYATVAIMPFGVSGDSMETFNSRLWIFNPAPQPFSTIPPGGLFQVSAPESVTDFATSDGGLLFTNSDSFLQTRYVAARQSNGYLYTFGDGSVSIISNVQTGASSSGGLPTTSFNYQNVDPQIGMSWRDSRQDFGRTVLFANETGVYGLYGGAVTKISSKLDDLFAHALFPQSGGVVPSSGTATIFDVKHFLMLLTVLDPDALFEPRTVMLVWNEREWSIASQSINLTYLATQKVSSTLNAYGTDGVAIYPLFQTPSPTLVKRIDTKLYGSPTMFMAKMLLNFYVQAQDKTFPPAGVALNIEMNVGGIGIQDPDYPSIPTNTYGGLLQPPNFQPGSNTAYFPVMGVGSGGVPFMTIGAQISSTSPDFVLGNLMFAYKHDTAFA